MENRAQALLDNVGKYGDILLDSPFRAIRHIPPLQ
jgi:hypothetical protein